MSAGGRQIAQVRDGKTLIFYSDRPKFGTFLFVEDFPEVELNIVDNLLDLETDILLVSHHLGQMLEIINWKFTFSSLGHGRYNILETPTSSLEDMPHSLKIQ